MQNKSFIFGVVSGVVGGVFGALLTSSFFAPPQSIETQPLDIQEVSAVEQLKKEMDSFRLELQALNLKMSSANQTSMKREPAGGFVSQKDFDELVQSLAKNDLQEPAQLKNQIEKTLKEVRNKEAEDKAIVTRKSQTDSMAGWLNLSDTQQVLYLEVLEERDAAALDFRERWEAGTLTQAEAGALKRENQTRHFDNVAAILNPEQLETFNRYRLERESWSK